MIKLREKYLKENNKVNIDEIRNSQANTKYTLPSDYVFVLLNYGKIEFNEIMTVEFKQSRLDFGEFYDLPLIEWQIKHTKEEKKVLNHDFWLNEYLCIGQITSKHILIGNKISNMNKIYFYDNEESQIEFASNNIFEFIELNVCPFETKQQYSG